MAGRDAAWLGQRLAAAAGHDLPLTDLVLSAVALRREYAVYSTDPHFDVVPDL
jgi:predicted nucleic acid-binding protein